MSERIGGNLPPGGADEILHRVVDCHIKQGKFTAAGAANEAVSGILELDGLKKGDIPATLPFVILGVQAKAKQYQPVLNGAAANVRKSAKQGDFREFCEDFSRIILRPAAMDEAPGTLRMPPIEMNLEQLLQHISLKRKKASETNRGADALEQFIAEHPEWHENPTLRMKDILNKGQSSAA